MTTLPRAVVYKGKQHQINWDTDDDILGRHGITHIGHNWGDGDSLGYMRGHPATGDDWCCALLDQSAILRAHPEYGARSLYMVGGDYGDAISRITSHADGSIRLYWRPYN